MQLWTYKHTHTRSLPPGTWGLKLSELLNRHGDFGAVEVSIKRWHERKNRFDKKGGWYTKIYLSGEKHWTK